MNVDFEKEIEHIKIEIEEIKEAIKHAEEVADNCKDINKSCSLEHSKLAKWLKQLLATKEIIIKQIEIDDRWNKLKQDD